MSLPRQILSVSELQDAIRDPRLPKCIPVGNRTKHALIGTPHQVVQTGETVNAETGPLQVAELSMAGLTGMTAYEPSEFLITARAGTSLRELASALDEHGQYLPFDPMFVSQGATVGGTIASGISGPTCMLYGGLRDFVMEIELVDGSGELCRGGGKVVKNAAGFDLPKLVCGSYGRLGALTEATLKVFPCPQESVSYSAQLKNLDSCVRSIQQLLSQPLPISSLDVLPDAGLHIKLSGPEGCLEQVINRTRAIVEAEGLSTENVPDFSGVMQKFADSVRHESDSLLVRVAMDVGDMPKVAAAVERIDGASVEVFVAGGCVAWLVLSEPPQLSEVDKQLRALGCGGVVVRGRASRLEVLGDRSWIPFAERIQTAVDPQHRFLAFS